MRLKLHYVWLYGDETPLHISFLQHNVEEKHLMSSTSLEEETLQEYYQL